MSLLSGLLGGGAGTSTQTANTTQNQTGTQTQNPWDQSVSLLQSILGGAGGVSPSITPQQDNAINGLTALANAGNPYASSVSDYANRLLSGGYATAQTPALYQGLQNLDNTLSGFTTANNLNPYNTPGLSDALKTLTSDITGQINGQFAGAGRDLSPSNTQALARGLSQGLASPLLGQYNQNVQNAFNAGNALYNAQNTTSGLVTGLQQQDLANRGAGVDAANSALSAAQQPYQAQLNAAALRTGLPLQTLQSLTQIGVPIAGLGGTTNTQGTMTGNTTQTTQASPLQQALAWTGIFKNLTGGGGGGGGLLSGILGGGSGGAGIGGSYLGMAGGAG